MSAVLEPTVERPPYRLKPTAVNGLLIVVVYGALLIGMQIVGGVKYDEIADSTSNLFRGVVIPVLVGAAVLTGFAVWSGWMRDVWVDRYRITGYVWMLLIPVLLIASVALNLVDADLGQRGAAFWVTLAAGVALVGYSEELLIRGLLVRGMRGSGHGDLRILLGSSVVFGLLHGLNLFAGQDLSTTMAQVGTTIYFGGYMYVCLRRTGLLVVPIVLHALWDFSVLARGETGSEVSLSVSSASSGIVKIGSILTLVLYVVLLASAIAIWRRGRGKTPPWASEQAPTAG